MSCGADLEANALIISLLAGKTFELPEVDLDAPEYSLGDIEHLTLPTQLTNDSLTTGVVKGDGTFDKLMASVAAHLKGEYEQSRISGDQYTKAYIAMMEAAVSGSVQFLLGRETAYWQAVGAQMQAEIAKTQLVTTRVQLEIAKAELQSKRYEALNQEAGYALIKMKLATEDMAYCLAKFNFEQMAPVQLLSAQEQMEAARAQTMNTRSDGVTLVTGLMGKQKDLYSQQITSYQRDAEVKAAKLFTDAWITMKTMDEGLLPPTQFNNTSLNEILTTLKVQNDLGV